jgi:hypothetical protein
MLPMPGMAGCRAEPPPVALDPNEALVARWTFEEGKGEVAADVSGGGHTATMREGWWGLGREGGGLSMDGGNDDIVVVPLSNRLQATGEEITVMAWAYRTAEHNVAVVAHAYPALFFGFHGPQFKWQLSDGDGDLRVRCYADPKHHAALNTWFHLAATYDGWMARLYVDGEEICNDWFWGSIGMPEGPFTLSGYFDDDGDVIDEMTGLLDDVRIYDRALDQEQIRSIYREVASP